MRVLTGKDGVSEGFVRWSRRHWAVFVGAASWEVDCMGGKSESQRDLLLLLMVYRSDRSCCVDSHQI